MRPSAPIFLGLVFLFALAGPGNPLHAAATRPVRVGVLVDNYPYSFLQADGTPAGFSYELVRELEVTMGLNFERVVGPTDRIAREFAEGRLDMLQSLAEFPERRKTAGFSVPYLNMGGSIFVRTGETGIHTLADLRGRRVLVHSGSLGETVLRRAGLADSIVIVPSVEEALKRLDRGEGDATLASHLTGLTLAHHFGLKGVKSLGSKIEGYDVRYCIAVQEGDRELLAQVNEGLAVLVRTGRYDEIYRKWFGQVVPIGYTKEEVFGAVAIGLALALVVALWAGAKQRVLRKRIAQQAEALRVSEERHRGIFEGTREGLLVLGRGAAGLVVEQANPAALQLLATPAEVAGQPLGALLAADPVLADRVQAAGLAGRTEEFEHERPGTGWLRVAVSPLGGRALVMLTDITDQVQARERLRRQEEQIRLKQKLEAVGTLAGGVAHDFNNLLTPIMGNTELCLMNLPPDHAEVGGLQQVQRAARRARDLVRQILTFSRQADPGREVVAVGPIINETVNLLRTMARGVVEFDVAVAADLPPILANPGQVHQVLMNIGTNAVQAVRGTAGQVAFRAEAIEVGPELQAQHPALRAGSYVRLAIQDNGPGMTPEVQRRVFEPFYTTKLPGEGTGLGLSVVHGIMEQHGGVVTLYSQPGRGTLFHVYFPTADAAPAAPAGAAVVTPPMGRGEAVLFVDDDQTIVAMVRKMMERLGYRVSVHDRAEQAWAEYAARPGEFAVIVSDLTMPGTNGLQLLSRVRGVSANQPFVLTSGFFSEAERFEAAALGVTLLLPKPLGYGELARAVAAALARR